MTTTPQPSWRTSEAFVGLCTAALLLTGCGNGGGGGGPQTTPSVSPTSESVTTPPATPPTPVPTQSPAVSKDRAEEAARKAVSGGTVRSSELDHENGRLVWNVEIIDARGEDHDVDIDANSGKVVRSSTDHNTGDLDHDQNDEGR